MRRVLLCLFTTFLPVGLAATPAAAQQTAAPPPGASAGQCFTRVVAPTLTETIEETVLVRPAAERIEMVPAVFEPSSVRVMVKEETIRFRMEPAVFQTVTEDILVEPERVVVEAVPAQYETYTETVVITPEREVWTPGSGIFGRTGTPAPGGASATGEVLCRVVEPAVTQDIQRVRLIAPPTTRERIVPARYETVSRRVEVTPARVVEELVPAEYRDVPTQIMVTPARETRISEPAIYETVTREDVVGGGEIVWAEVLCETNTTRFKVAEIQGALTDAGYPTRVDGVFGPNTLRAMQRFQADNALAEGYLTIDTVQALGVDPYSQPPDVVFALLGGRVEA